MLYFQCDKVYCLFSVIDDWYHMKRDLTVLSTVNIQISQGISQSECSHELVTHLGEPL